MSSTSQDPPDSVLLAGLGEALLNVVVETCTFTLVYGVFILLFSQTTVTYLKKKQASRAQYWMFLASATTFLLATIHEATELVAAGIYIHSALVGYQGLSLIEKRPLVNGLLTKPYFLLTGISVFEPIISDSIVVWRVAVLMQDRKWLKLLPLTLLLGSFASLLAFLILTVSGADPDDRLVNNLGSVGNGLSIATNVVATALIAYIYWLHRRDMVAGLGTHRPTQGERVLVLLVESGIVFFIPQLISFILGFLPQSSVRGTAGNYAWDIFATAFLGFSIMYPTIVIALVNSHRTFDHMYSTNVSLPTISHGTDSGHTTTIRFAETDPAASAGTLPKLVEKNSDAQMS